MYRASEVSKYNDERNDLRKRLYGNGRRQQNPVFACEK
jgi:hypothetical protein